MKVFAVIIVVFIAGFFAYQQFWSNNDKPLELLYEAPYIVVYGQTSCTWTQKCLRELQEQGIDPIFENIDKQDVKMEIFPRVDAAGHSRNQIVLPIVDVNGHILVGYELEKILGYYQKGSTKRGQVCP